MVNFNSIKVRLERSSSFDYLVALRLFQFHKGTIRTLIRRVVVTDDSIFQFHKGTIRTIKRASNVLRNIIISIP